MDYFLVKLPILTLKLRQDDNPNKLPIFHLAHTQIEHTKIGGGTILQTVQVPIQTI